MSTAIIVEVKEREHSSEPQYKYGRKSFSLQRPDYQAWFVLFLVTLITASLLSCIFTYAISYDNNSSIIDSDVDSDDYKGNMNYIGRTGLNGVSVLLVSMTCLAFLSGITGLFLRNKTFMLLFIIFQIAVFSSENFMLTVYSAESKRNRNVRLLAGGVFLFSVLACWQAFRIISPRKDYVDQKFSASSFEDRCFSTSTLLVILVIIL